MRRLILIALVGTIGLAAASCTSEEDTSTVTTTPVPVPSPQASPTAPAFSKPLVAQKPGAAGTPAVPGLLKSTNPNERAKQVQASIGTERSRVQNTLRSDKDPFASTPLTIAAEPQPTGTQASPAGPSQSVPSLPNSPRPQVGVPLPSSIGIGAGGRAGSPRPPRPSSPFPPNARRTTASRPNTTAGRPARSPLPSVPQVATRPGSPRPVSPGSSVPSPGSPLPTGTPGATSPNGVPIAQIPPAPSTTVASSTEVSGVVQIGNDVQAIVKAPNEPASRYVRPGQRIANGQVLVKRIEMNAGAEPLVILEENGVEVARAVGEGSPAQTPT